MKKILFWVFAFTCIVIAILLTGFRIFFLLRTNSMLDVPLDLALLCMWSYVIIGWQVLKEGSGSACSIGV